MSMDTGSVARAARRRALRWAGAALAVTLATSAALTAQPVSTPPLTVERLKALRSTSNDPGGDAFIGSPQELRAVVDALAADTSLASPMLLFMASNTAMRQGLIEQAAFLFYAAQIRGAFDFERYDVASRPDGSNAATYLSFLKETTGMSVNPAIMREPARFAAVVARLEKWDVVPAPGAYYPEFEQAKGFKLPRERWTARGAEIKEDFLSQFARPMARLLSDPEYAAALRFVQDVNFGKVELTDKTEAQFNAAVEKMSAAEARAFPGRVPPRPPLDPPDAGTGNAPEAPDPAPPAEEAPVSVDGDMPVRVGGDVPTPKKLKHVEPEFPSGSRGSVIAELVIDRDGRVADVHILRADPGLAEIVEDAVRQWVYEPVRVKGQPVRVLLTVSVPAR